MRSTSGYFLCASLLLQFTICKADGTCTSAPCAVAGDAQGGTSLLQSSSRHKKQVMDAAEYIEETATTPVPQSELDETEQPQDSIDEDMEDTHDKCQQLHDQTNISFDMCVECAQSCMEATAGEDADGQADKDFVTCHEECLGSKDSDTDALEQEWLVEEAGGGVSSSLLQTEDKRWCRRRRRGGGCGCWCRRRRAAPVFSVAAAGRIPYEQMDASQSSVYASAKASTALVAQHKPNWPGTCTHTMGDAQPWWKVSLGGSERVASVVLTNRGDCCSDRLQGVDIFVGSSKCASNVKIGQGAHTKVDCFGTGSEIKVQRQGSGILQICGFAAFEDLSGTACPSKYPVCDYQKNCVTRSCSSGACQWNRSPSADTDPGETYNWISGYDNSNTDCSGDNQATPARRQWSPSTCGDLNTNENSKCKAHVAWASSSGKSHASAPSWYSKMPEVSGVSYQEATLEDFQRLFRCVYGGEYQCHLPPCTCSKPPCDVCTAGTTPAPTPTPPTPTPTSPEAPTPTPPEAWKPPSGPNKAPPPGYVAKPGSGKCQCKGSGMGLDSCGELCCAASPYTDPDPNGKYYYAKGGKSLADMCYEKAQDSSSQTGGGSALSQAQIDAVVSKHNTLRAAVGASDMMMLKWNPELAKRAQEHSSTCPGSTHSSRSSRGHDGENMAGSAGSNFQLTATTDLTSSVQRWYDEISDAGTYRNGGTFSGYDPCTGVCGHYTQVVWAAANEIGCGVTSCPLSGMPGYQLTCQYRSTLPGKYGGNMLGSVLFTKGTACASCPNGNQRCSTSPAGLCLPDA